VAVADLNNGAAQSVADEINSGGTAIAVGMDVTNEGQVQSAVSDVVARHGGVDVLVSNAGIQIVHRIESFLCVPKPHPSA
jgi:3-hydroxybutyrate dehydrogenase